MALRRFTERMREAREAGESHDELRNRLLAGLDEVRGLAGDGPDPSAADPRATARSVLAQPSSSRRRRRPRRSRRPTTGSSFAS
jgi:hypothetical protein